MTGKAKGGAVQIVAGLAPDQREAAARLYWLAFGAKLRRIYGPERRAHSYFARVFSEAHCLTVQDGNRQLIALAGFKSPEGSLVHGGHGDLRAVYGRFGAMWRGLALWLLQGDVENRRFLIDGICVAPDHRGKGIGHALVAALADIARSRGYAEMRLEVRADNAPALRLYEACGFALLARERPSLILWASGIGRALVMVRKL